LNKDGKTDIAVPERMAFGGNFFRNQKKNQFCNLKKTRNAQNNTQPKIKDYRNKQLKNRSSK